MPWKTARYLGTIPYSSEGPCFRAQANPAALDGGERTPLHRACQAGAGSTTEILLGYDSGLALPDKSARLYIRRTINRFQKYYSLIT